MAQNTSQAHYFKLKLILNLESEATLDLIDTAAFLI